MYSNFTAPWQKRQPQWEDGGEVDTHKDACRKNGGGRRNEDMTVTIEQNFTQRVPYWSFQYNVMGEIFRQRNRNAVAAAVCNNTIITGNTASMTLHCMNKCYLMSWRISGSKLTWRRPDLGWRMMSVAISPHRAASTALHQASYHIYSNATRVRATWITRLPSV